MTLPPGETPNFSALYEATEPFLSASTLLPVSTATTYGYPNLPNPYVNTVLENANEQLAFTYDAGSRTLKYSGIMTAAVEAALLSMRPGFLDATTIGEIYAQSQLEARVPIGGYNITGPGTLQINAASLNLGNGQGIVSQGLNVYSALAPYTARGADIDISVSGDLTMLSSTIESEYGGAINITSGGTVDLGSALVRPPAVNILWASSACGGATSA